MQRGERLLLMAGTSSIFGLLLIGMLFFQLKRVEVLTRNAEVELQLGRQKKLKLEAPPPDADAVENVDGGSRTEG